MTATSFTPLAALIGGAMVGGAAVLLMAFEGRIAGVSGIAARLLPPYRDHAFPGRFAFILGLIGAPFIIAFVTGTDIAKAAEASPVLLAVAGFLVGFGSVWGNGCTSGHGICGLSRLSLRSLIATVIFMITAVITVFVVRHVA
jgi:uncharacterized membrane protein YedE/YeeE